MSYFHPERMPVMPAGRRQAARRQLEELVVRSARFRGRRGPGVIATAAAVLVILSVAASAVAYHLVTDKAQARCFAVADPNAGAAYYVNIANAGKPRTIAEINDARAQCAALYRIGMLKNGHRVLRPPFTRGSHPVPHLVVCAWPDGTAAVFPGPPGTCSKIGLSAAARRLSRLTPPAARYGGPGSLSQTGAAVPLSRSPQVERPKLAISMAWPCTTSLTMSCR